MSDFRFEPAAWIPFRDVKELERVRNIRRDANEALKKMKTTGDISEDDFHRAHDTVVQDMTNEHIDEIDKALAAKEKELMEV